MRRWIAVVLLAILIVAPMVLRKVLAGSQQGEAASSAKESNIPRLVIVTSHMQDIRNEFRWAFSKWHEEKYHEPVDVEYLTPGGTNDIQRLLETKYKVISQANGGQLPPEDQIRNVDIDIVWGGGDFFFNNKLKPLGILRTLDIDPALLREAISQPTLAGVKLYDQDIDKSGNPMPPRWVGVCLGSFGIVYNEDMYRALGLDAPTTWVDLTNEKLAGSVALADPTHSGSAAVTYMMVLEKAMAGAEKDFFDQQPKDSKPDAMKKLPGYHDALAAGWKKGMRELLLIAANARYFSDSATQVPNDVASGDAAAGVAIDFYGRVTQETVGVNRCRYVTPPAATAITPDPVAILYGTQGKQLELSKHFVDFLLSKQGQLLWILKPGEPGGPRLRSLHRAPITPELYQNRAGWADDLDYYNEAGGFNQRGDWTAPMSDLTQIWAAAWIDDRDDLRSAYAAILAMPDSKRRQELIFQLSELPISMDDVTKLIAERKKMEATPGADSDQWKAQSRIKWAGVFREHYQSVAADAVASGTK